MHNLAFLTVSTRGLCFPGAIKYTINQITKQEVFQRNLSSSNPSLPQVEMVPKQTAVYTTRASLNIKSFRSSIDTHPAFCMIYQKAQQGEADAV